MHCDHNCFDARPRLLRAILRLWPALTRGLCLCAWPACLLSVTQANEAPTISAIAPQTIEIGTSSRLVAFIVGDLETPADRLTVTGISSDTTLVRNEAIVVLGTGADRAVTLVPELNRAGACTIKLQVVDGNGSVAETSFLFTVTPSRSPIVKLTSPTQGQFMLVPPPIILEADAIDLDAKIVKVEFYQGTTKLETDFERPYRYSWEGVASGQYVLTAVAVDDRGQSTRSDPVMIQVVNRLITSITEEQVSEESAGTNSHTILIPVRGVPAQKETFKFFTSDGTAIGGKDYVPSRGEIVLQPNTITATIKLETLGNAVDEPDRIFLVNWTGPNASSLISTQIVVRIVDDDPPASLSVDSKPVTEGDSGTTKAIFSVKLSPPSGHVVTVNFTTADGTATAGSDYLPRSGTLTFKPGETNQTVTVDVLGDNRLEQDETFLFSLNDATNAVITAGPSQGIIINDDQAPIVSIQDAQVREGIEVSTNAVFLVSLSAASDRTVTVDFVTSNDTAMAGDDYLAQSGTLIFGPGETNKAITVLVRADTLAETTEFFWVRLSAPANATIGRGEARGEILDERSDPKILVDDIQVIEGAAGTSKAFFPVRLSKPSSLPVSVNVKTSNGTATAARDYSARSAQLIFNPGEISQTMEFSIIGDTLDEPDETFFVELSNPTNAIIVGGQGVVTILDDDRVPGISISDAAVSEGDARTVNIGLTVSLSKASTQTVSVHVSTQDGTARAESDYDQVSDAVLRFLPGETKKTIALAVKSDELAESEEIFFVNLGDPLNARILDNQAVVTITDNDTPVGISISDAAGTESDSGNVNLVFTIRLSQPSNQPITVSYSTVDGTAKAGSDYESVTGSVTFPLGSTAQTIAVAVKGDLVDEDDEEFFVELSNPINSILLDERGVGFIADSDGPPTISIGEAPVVEGDAGLVSAPFAVTLSAPSQKTITVDFETVAESASAGDDFEAVSGHLTFPPGVTSQMVLVGVRGDTASEGLETFSVYLRNPVNGILGSARGIGTILDDDVAPTLSTTDAFVVEGSSGTNYAVFTVRLSLASSELVTVQYATADQTAKAGSDYMPAAGTISFRPGTITNVVKVAIIADALDEGNETFELRLSNPFHAILSDDVGLGTIFNDDVASVLTIADSAWLEGNAGTANALIIVRLSTASGHKVAVDFRTRDGTAAAGSDYKAVSGTLEFDPGVTLRTIAVPIQGDSLPEPNETFFVHLTNAVDTIIDDGQALVTILNDDGAANIPPTVRIITPANGAAFPATAELTITAEANDPDGTVQRVDFFAGSTFLGSATRPPFDFVWPSVAPGTYSLVARATDNKQASVTSDPVNVLVSRSVSGSDVVIVQDLPHPEILRMQDYLMELNLSSQVLDRESITFEAIKDAKLVVWSGLDSSKQTKDANVALLRKTFDANIPIYFIGEALAASSKGLSPLQQADWIKLVHLNSAAGSSSDGTAVVDGTLHHPVIAGHFGMVSNFGCSTGLEGRIQPVPGATLLAKSGTADLLVAFEPPEPERSVRTVTQNCRPAEGPSRESAMQQKKLFKNAAAWLLRKSFLAVTDLSVAVEGPGDPVPFGDELIYNVAINHSGEIEGTGIVVSFSLAPGLKFVRADFVQGRLTQSEGRIDYAVGNMENGQRIGLSLVLAPTLGGTLLSSATVTANEPDPSLPNNVAWIETDIALESSNWPVLRALGFDGSGFQFEVMGGVAQSYRIEASSNLVDWAGLTNLIRQGSSTILTDPAANNGRRFYRLVSP